jgi:hypothetical protein
MVWQSIAANIGGQLAGGLVNSVFGSKGPSFQAQLNDQLQATKKLTRSQNYHAFEATIEAAKANKIHPLAAIGTSVGGASMPIYNNNESGQIIDGQNLGRAAASIFSGKRERQMQDLALERAHLENDLLRSQITSVNSQPGDAPTPVVGSSPINGNRDNVDYQPHEEISKRGDDSGVAAGLPPGLAEYDIGNNQTIILPYTQEGPGEAMENMSFPFNKIKEAEFWYKRYYKKSPGQKAAEIYRKLKKKGYHKKGYKSFTRR